MDRKWYGPIIGFLAALDYFILCVPTDGLVISSALLRPSRWFKFAIVTTFCSAVGACLLAWLVTNFTSATLSFFGVDPQTSSAWQQTEAFVANYGTMSLALMAAGPIPLHPGIWIVGAMEMAPLTVFLTVFLGRLAKYTFFAYLAARVPHLLKRLGLLSKGED